MEEMDSTIVMSSQRAVSIRNSKTGQMGAHGENASSEDKRWMGQIANENTRGDWTRGVKN